MSKKKCKLLLRPVFFINIDITFYKQNNQPTNQPNNQPTNQPRLLTSKLHALLGVVLRQNKLPNGCSFWWHLRVSLPKRCHAFLSYYLMERKSKKKRILASMWQKKGGENQHFERGLSVISCIPPGSSPSSPTEKKPWCLGVEKTISIYLQRPMRSSEFFSNTLPTIVSEGPVWDPFVWFESGKKPSHRYSSLQLTVCTWKWGCSPWKRRFLLETAMFRCYVNFLRECSNLVLSPSFFVPCTFTMG